MELFNQNSIENGFLICNKTEQHKPLIELLYESRKRTGGDDIKELHFDRSLNQYLCIYYKPETSKNVIKHGPVTFHQTVFLPMEIDRTKIILENVDETLEMDTVSLYADYLFQDMIRSGPSPKVERLKSGFVLIALDISYDIERLKSRHRKRNRLQNKDIILHFVAKTDSCASFYTQILMKRPIFNCSPDVKLNLIPNIKKQDAPVCRSLVLIQDSDEETSISSTSSAYSSISTMSQRTTTTTAPNITSESSSSSSSPLTMTSSSSSNLRTMEMRLRMFESLVGNLKKVLDMAANPSPSSSSSSSPSSSRSPRSESPTQQQQQQQQQQQSQKQTQPKQDQNTIVENSLSKSTPSRQPQQSSAAEFAPPIITLNRVTQNSGIIPRTGLVRVRNIVQEMPATSTSSQRPHPFSSIIHQQSRSNPNAALNLRRMILNHANSSNHHVASAVQPSAPPSPYGGGLSLSMIARFPIIIYQRPVATSPANNAAPTTGSCCSSSKCSICLESFKDNQEVRLLSCFHQFHVECIDTWLMEKSTCPTCKFNLAFACETE